MGKNKVNAYMTYMQQQRKEVPGWANKSNQELMTLCNKGWKALSAEERARYQNLSKTIQLEDTRPKGQVRMGGFDSLGRPLLEITRRDEEIKRIHEHKRRTVEELVHEAKQKGELVSCKFCVVASSIFVQTEEDPAIFVPAELSVAIFSLKNGVDDEVYQVFPHPGSIPIGYRARCKENSDRSHRVPLEGVVEEPEVCYGDKKVDFITKDATTVLVLFYQYIAKKITDKYFLFTMPHLVEQVEGVLATLHRRAPHLPRPPLQVLPLPRLLFELAGSPDLVPTVHMAEVELEKERFLYRPDLSCDWHAAHTDTNDCTASTARRWSFTVLDLVCGAHNIQMVEGKHLPKGLQTKSLPPIDWPEEKPRPLPPFSVSRSSGQGKFPAVDIRQGSERITSEDRDDILGSKVDSIAKMENNNCDIKNNNMSRPSYLESCKEYEGAKSSTRDTITEFMDNLTVKLPSTKKNMETEHFSASSTRDTISEFMDDLNLSQASTCSTDSEFIDMSSLTARAQCDHSNREGVLSARNSPPKGRGQPVKVKRSGRVAANFVLPTNL